VLGVASYVLNLKKDVYSFDGNIVGIDASSGALLYRVPVTGAGPGPCVGGSGVSVWSSAAIDPALGLAYIGTGQTYEQPASTCNDSLLAIHYKADYVGDRFAWKATFTVDDVFISAGGGMGGLDHDVGAAPNLFRAGDVQAVGVGDKGGTYRAFDRATGAQLWRTELNHGAAAQLGGVMTTAAVYQDTIYVASNSWMAFGFVSTGMHAEADTSTLYALDVRTGAPRWMQTLDAPVFGTFAIANGMLFHPTLRGVVRARDLQTGQELWRGETGSAIGSGIGIDNDGLYVSTGLAISVRTPVNPAQVVAYTVAPETKTVVDLRDDTFKQLTVEQCQTALATLQPDPTCRSCLCDCNPSTTGACQGGCWQQAPCLVKSCATSDFSAASGQACYAENCASKLLPPNVYQESVRSATCAVKCAASCGF
jgi:outer membrane protein assembly factor BamB